MKIKDIILTASSNLFRSKLRTILTILAIFVGAFTLTLTQGIGAGISKYIDKQVGNLGQKDVLTITLKSNNDNFGPSDKPQKYDPSEATSSIGFPGAGSLGVLTSTDIKKLKEDKDLKDVQPTYAINLAYIQGVNDDKYKIMGSPLTSGSKLDLAAGQQLEGNSQDNQIILQGSYVKSLGFDSAEESIGKQVTLATFDAYGKEHTLKSTIVGVQQKGLVGSSGASFNGVLMDNIYNFQSLGLPDASKNKFQSASAKMVGEMSDSHIAKIKDKLSKDGYSGQSLDDALGSFKSVISTVTAVLSGFAVITLLAASFGIVNTLLMSVQERTKEIGLMKAMGMRSGRIFFLFSMEAILIGFWGSAIGAGVAVLVGQGINSFVANGILKDLPGFKLLSFSPVSIIGIILLIMLIAFLAGTLPARKASKQNPIDALRYE